MALLARAGCSLLCSKTGSSGVQSKERTCGYSGYCTQSVCVRGCVCVCVLASARVSFHHCARPYWPQGDKTPKGPLLLRWLDSVPCPALENWPAHRGWEHRPRPRPPPCSHGATVVQLAGAAWPAPTGDGSSTVPAETSPPRLQPACSRSRHVVVVEGLALLLLLLQDVEEPGHRAGLPAPEGGDGGLASFMFPSPL